MLSSLSTLASSIINHLRDDDSNVRHLLHEPRERLTNASLTTAHDQIYSWGKSEDFDDNIEILSYRDDASTFLALVERAN